MKHFKITLILTILMSMVGIETSSQTLIDGIYYNLDSATLEAQVTSPSGRKYGGKVVIPSSVIYENNTYSVTSIGTGAFEGCTGLTAITIPNSVTSIGDGAFYGCTGLTTLTIPNSVSSIGYIAFAGCTGLTAIVVSEGNKEYDSRNNCNAIIYTATNCLISGCKNTVIPNSVTSIGEGAFYGCTDLTTITIPNSVSSIGFYTFYGCTGLTSVAIPNSVKSIGFCAFQGCTGLTKITIPNSVTTIDYKAFSSANLMSVTSLITNPNSIPSSSFYSETFENGTLYIPVGTKEKYMNTDGWKLFAHMEEIDISAISSTRTDKNFAGKKYSLSGQLVDDGYKGIVIQNGKKMLAK